jgi:hypothetical protein
VNGVATHGSYKDRKVTFPIFPENVTFPTIVREADVSDPLKSYKTFNVIKRFSLSHFGVEHKLFESHWPSHYGLNSFFPDKV